jgi:hypothetical protein
MDGGVVLASDEVYFSLFFFSFHLFGVLGIFCFFLKDEKNTLCAFWYLWVHGMK